MEFGNFQNGYDENKIRNKTSKIIKNKNRRKKWKNEDELEMSQEKEENNIEKLKSGKIRKEWAHSSMMSHFKGRGWSSICGTS